MFYKEKRKEKEKRKSGKVLPSNHALARSAVTRGAAKHEAVECKTTENSPNRNRFKTPVSSAAVQWMQNRQTHLDFEAD